MGPKWLAFIGLMACCFCFKSCDSCGCKGKNEQPELTKKQKHFLPDHAPFTHVIFKNGEGEIDTFYYRETFSHNKPNCGTGGFPVPSSCCICPADHTLYYTIGYREKQNSGIFNSFFLINMIRDSDHHSFRFELNHHQFSLEDSIKLDSMVLNNRSFTGARKFGPINTGSAYADAVNSIQTLFYTPQAGLIKIVRHNDSEWVRQFK